MRPPVARGQDQPARCRGEAGRHLRHCKSPARQRLSGQLGRPPGNKSADNTGAQPSWRFKWSPGRACEANSCNADCSKREGATNKPANHLVPANAPATGHAPCSAGSCRAVGCSHRRGRHVTMRLPPLDGGHGRLRLAHGLCGGAGPRGGLLARRAPLIEQAWVRVAREALARRLV